MENARAVLLGGAHGTLALARCLGRQNVVVTYMTSDTPLPGWSRFVRETIRWPGPNDERAISFLLQMANDRQWQGSLLVPAGDGEVRLVSEHLATLSQVFKVKLPAWEALRWLCEKPLLYKRAVELNVGIPRTYQISSAEQIATLEVTFPVVLKPNMGGGKSRISRAKVIKADDRATLTQAYRDASEEIGGDNIVVQELIPGGGESQFSYAAFWHAGEPVAEFAARRARQYPVDFGYTSTFVEVVDEPQAITAARALLKSIRHDGLVEVEFKRDHRNGSLKLLDVNPRPWSWFGLCSAAGIDLGTMLWQIVNDRPAQPGQARLGASWMYLVRDAAGAIRMIARGQIGIAEYLRSFKDVRAWATFATDDPMPGLIDLPLTIWRALKRRVLERV